MTKKNVSIRGRLLLAAWAVLSIEAVLFAQDMGGNVRVKKFMVNAGDDRGALLENVYVLYVPQTGDAMIVDPGAVDPRIDSFIRESQLRVAMILNTHGHFDHVKANRHYADLYNVKIGASALDLFLYVGEYAAAKPGVYLKDNDEISLGNQNIRVIHTPGHTPGSLCFLIEDKLLTGDTLFAGSVGKTDGNSEKEKAKELKKEIRSIRQKLLVIADDTWVFPGHGYSTTIGDEKSNNPFLQTGS